ncbi:acyl-ACP--UDP-N-acetylglucosamine O-acyltransferase [Plasticicumulans acidivorans]|uniref:Acyl-[acyl-carrier-protein]--UDP-N-acetylglucosamine O-acyltransferase n=1 Tax=Plasticicumulans acidivorans TaxID=886464 RepID=A0A317MYZ6_9GAMM|nr:acyl-ACP--UDP-N-acetylglucosamine O-acyltransferase [Plasticicumulans acidivorans]PWV63512.1 acyl-[acyl-carrier-protein]--UDP-N-acetylglucosamine O-acyltransferase [Plasticicumulans acidivorans]
MIDARAVIDPSARLAADVSVGPFSIIGPDVEIGAGTEIGPHVVIKGPTTIGRDNRIFQFASIGDEPQDKKYAGEPTRLEIGDRNTIREYVTINRGTVQDVGVTRLGSDNWIMAYVHIAHDCQVGDNTIFANNASLAGHVHVGDWAILGGYTLVHQFCRIGAHSFCGFATGVQRDVPPYFTVAGYRAEPHGINSEGLKRRGYPAEEIAAIKRAYKLVYMSELKLAEAIESIREMERDWPRLALLADFLAASDRGVVR